MRAVAGGTDKIVLSKGSLSLGFRLTFLAFGLVFLPIGLFASGKVVLATLDILLGRAFEGSFLLGLIIALGFTVFGALAVWTYFMPAEDLVFDSAAKTLTSKRSYPFGRVRTEVVALSDLAPPEVVWKKDPDRSADGFWCLSVKLPSGRRFEHEPPAHSPDGQKRASETLRDNILALSE